MIWYNSMIFMKFLTYLRQNFTMKVPFNLRIMLIFPANNTVTR
jgi:hypothetical protein